MEPITNEEKYLAALTGESVILPDPITRKEIFLAAAAGVAVSVPDPITREEIYLSQIKPGDGTGVVLEPLTVTENGEYTPGEGVDGFDKVTVTVEGSVPERTAWYRPPDWPDITRLPLGEVDGYFTVDKLHPSCTGEIPVTVVGNGNSLVDLGDVVDGVFVPVLENHNLLSTTVTLDLSTTKTDFPVIAIKCDNDSRYAAMHDDTPIVEVSAKKKTCPGWTSFKTCRVITLGESGSSFASNGLGARGYSSANLRYLDLSKYTGYNDSQVRTLYYIFNDFKALTVLKFPTVPQNSMLLSVATQSDWPDAAFNGCESLLELDLSIFDTSEVTRLTSLVADCTSLHTLNLSGWNLSDCTGMSNTFKRCTALVNLITTGATMPAVSFSLSDSTLLSVDSLIGVIAALPVLADGTSATLTLGATNTAKLTAEQLAVATEKGWTVA